MLDIFIQPMDMPGLDTDLTRHVAEDGFGRTDANAVAVHHQQRPHPYPIDFAEVQDSVIAVDMVFPDALNGIAQLGRVPFEIAQDAPFVIAINEGQQRV